LKGRLNGKKLLLGVTGSIAAYKACLVLRQCIREGADVRVIMTENSRNFVAPLTFETLSGHEVVTELFPGRKTVKTRHIQLAEWGDGLFICPATANIIAKSANGIADDFLSTLILAVRCPVLFAPAMDFAMVENPLYLENVERLKNHGYRFVETEEGDLASGALGKGRLADIPRLMDAVRSFLISMESLKGLRVLVSAGPTREFIDPVRYLTNRSSGKMGYALAEEALLRGADVTLISGPVSIQPAQNVKLVSVVSAAEMEKEIISHWPSHDILIMAAAVADYTPRQKAENKIKKGKKELPLLLDRTVDILKKAAGTRKGKTVVGFALETDDGENRAMAKCREKGCDLICLNNPLESGSGFDTDTNRITLIEDNGDKETLPLMPKWQASQRIFDRIEAIRKARIS
jgi:phosphopantothenoylcysteine decarboxylase/phosphopantothenate--cysteine ligase